MRTHLDDITKSAPLTALARAVESPAQRHLGAVGAAGSSTALVAGALAQLSKRLVVLVLAHLDDADEAVDELAACGISATRLPALELLPGETAVSLELFAERVSVVRQFVEPRGPLPQVLVCPIPALMQSVPEPARLADLSLTLAPGDQRGRDAIVRWLDDAGFRRCDSIEEPGDFAVRGGILDLFPVSGAGATPVRLDFFGDELESISEVDLDTMGSDRRIEAIEVIGARRDLISSDQGVVSPLELIPRTAIALVAETIEVTEQGRGYFERITDSRGIDGPPAVFKRLRERFHAFVEINQFSSASHAGVDSIALPARVLPEFARDAQPAIEELGAMSREHRTLVLCQNPGELQRLGELLEQFAPGHQVESRVAYLHRGFIWGADDKPVALVPYHELLHRYQTRRRIRRLKSGRAADTFLVVDPGDFVVHSDHGIARFLGLKSMKPRAPKPTADQAADQLLTAAGAKPARKSKSGQTPEVVAEE
jgi:transcription-repair coupling factor (superfamily II helicase)